MSPERLRHYIGDALHDRIMKRTQIPNGEDGCWICSLHPNHTSGYAMIQINKQPRYVHRVVHMACNPLVDIRGLVVRHKCDVKRCINPSHLDYGTQADNIGDRDTRGRTARVLGELNHATRLKDKEVGEIFRLFHHDGWQQREIARFLGISATAVSQLLAGKKRVALTVKLKEQHEQHGIDDAGSITKRNYRAGHSSRRSVEAECGAEN